ncbi:hypothetical protein GIB67_025945 [Kingdonia uniflora]|uniref:Uncharacterized protein n=1 Tax=Kingdonia uniflora TaxID=39325 RepID=A0A7J7PBQ7_9MAGN|nr:hypothetical protein GIB67_025945 [Kingdonia uniflora]
MSKAMIKLFLCVLVLESMVLFLVEARTLNGFDRNMLIKQYFLDGIKNSGPTTDGDGHGYTNAAKTLSGRKVSGPSPDVGHKFTTVQTLGGVKDAGPSPGNGHKYITGNNQ